MSAVVSADVGLHADHDCKSLLRIQVHNVGAFSASTLRSALQILLRARNAMYSQKRCLKSRNLKVETALEGLLMLRCLGCLCTWTLKDEIIFLLCCYVSVDRAVMCHLCFGCSW